jgi:dUTP pyrophosphatase
MTALRVEAENVDLYAGTARNYATDSGFDLICPTDLVVPAGETVFVDLGIRCQLEGATHGYYLYPRSSLSKTPLRLANSVGIIDAGYRGTLKAAVDNRSGEAYAIKKGDRLFQICMPSLEPFRVVFGTVDRVTERGEGGFGSTSQASEQGERSIGSTSAAEAGARAAAMSPAAIAIARGAGLRDPHPPQYNIHYSYFV